MDPIAVTAALLREQLPDVPLRPGATLMARVASRGEQHAVIVLAGIPVTARVPEGIESGATLRLKVQEVTPERITLQIDPGAPVVAPAAPPAAARQPARITVEEPPARRRGADGEPADVVALAFHSPALGRLDLRLELREGRRLLADVGAAAGAPHDLVSADAERLRAKLIAAGLEPTVRVRPRRRSFDAYA